MARINLGKNCLIIDRHYFVAACFTGVIEGKYLIDIYVATASNMKCISLVLDDRDELKDALDVLNALIDEPEETC